MRVSAVLSAILMMLSPTLAAAQDARFERSGVYVAVSDIGRSTAFYAQVLDRQPSVNLPVFVGFDVAGGLVAIVDRRTFAPDSRPGGAVVPYIKVRDIETEFERVRGIAPVSIQGGIIAEGPLKLFKIADPDGNLIEFYQIAPPG